MRRLLLLVPILLGAVLVTPAGALPGYGSQDLVPVAGAPLRDGWVSGVQANGAMYSAGVLFLGGAQPNATYTVERKLHTTGEGCTAFFANVSSSTTVTTNGAGNATASLLTPRSVIDDQLPFLHGVTVGQIIEISVSGGSLAYTTTCVEFTMH